MYSLQRFQESLVHLREILLLASEHQGPNEEAMKLASERIIEVEQRLREKHDGIYDFQGIARALTKRKPLLDHATYLGPLQVRETEGRGRGLFLTKSVKAGQLLFCEKAFTAVYEEPDCTDKMTFVNVNINTNRITIGTQAVLVTETTQKLFRNPSLSPRLLSLHSAADSDARLTIIDEKPIIDRLVLVSLRTYGLY